MKLEEKHYYWIGAAVLVTAIGVVVYRKKKLVKEGQNNYSTEKSTYIPEEPISASLFPLKYGSKNYEVKVVQQYMNTTCPKSLKEQGVYPLVVDGIWGRKTDKSTNSCTGVQGDNVSQELYKRMVRDLTAANVLPKK